MSGARRVFSEHDSLQQTQEGLSSLLKDEQAAGGVVRRDSLMV